jgi:hypothetical protein
MVAKKMVERNSLKLFFGKGKKGRGEALVRRIIA